MLVGHDWGAAVAWWVAMWHPESIATCSILNVPHPKRMNAGLWRPSQLLRSWYMFFFQIPWLPERALKAGALGMVKKSLQATRRPGAVTKADLEEYEKAFSRSDAMRGPVNYYRSAMRSRGALAKRLNVIDAPTMVIWGRHDAYLGLHMAEPDRADVPNLRMEYLEASHWVQIDEAERVSELLVDFIDQQTAS